MQVSTVKFEVNSPEESYSKHLTSFIFVYLSNQLKLVDDIVTEQTDDKRVYITNTCHKTTANSCDCIFHTAMGLPCKHIFAVRKLQEIPLFDANLCDIRWTKKYFHSSYKYYYEERNNQKEVQIDKNTISIHKARSQISMNNSGNLPC